jgi:hypothetical protein
MNREQYETGIQLSIVNKSARITLKVAGKLNQFSLTIVTYGPEFESDFRLMRTTYWATLLALDARSLVCCVLIGLRLNCNFPFFFTARYN